MNQLPLEIGFDAEQSFENFLPGANGPALEHLRGLRAPGAPVYLWGPAGSGKTHLLRALAQRWGEAGGQVCWFDPLLSAAQEIDADRVLLLLDECDGYGPAAQHAAFALFVDATTLGHAVVAAGRVPPVDLPLRDDLRSRLGWGHIHALQALPDADARAALQREAQRRGLALHDDVMTYLLNRFERDLKHLTARLDAFDRYAMASKRAPTLGLLRQMLAEEEA